jgi:hypothetical protein
MAAQQVTQAPDGSAVAGEGGGGGGVCIEVDGPSHFTVGERRLPLGHTRLRNQLLAARYGLTVLSVPYWEWNELHGKQGTGQYLRMRLRQEGNMLGV